MLIALVSSAQEGTSSPYSFYGIGDVKFKGTAENRMMGGVSVFSDSIHINLQNPAHYSGIKYTTFTSGGTTMNTNVSTENQSEKARRTTLDYLAIGIPAGKLGFAFGLMPYSSVGYKIFNLSDDTNAFTTRYNGIGGINKVFLGAGYAVTKKLNLGVDIQYNFGTIETESFRFLDEVENGTREVNTSRINGLNVTFGSAYETNVTKKHKLFATLVYTPNATLRLANQRTITVSNDQTDDQTVQNSNFSLPSRLSAGAGFGEVRKWLVGAEVTLQANSNLKNRFNDISGVIFENSTRYSIGGYFIPKYNSFTDYYKRITYRGGFRFENTGMIINDKAINDVAATIGFGLPLSGSFSNLNVGFEVGKRGTTYNNLIEENYFNISIGLSFNDKWFVKRKYY